MNCIYVRHKWANSGKDIRKQDTASELIAERGPDMYK